MPKSTEFKQAQILFMAALEQPAGDWATFLEKACGGESDLRDQVHRPLHAHESEGGLLDSPVNLSPDMASGERIGTQIGVHKLVEQLGGLRDVVLMETLVIQVGVDKLKRSLPSASLHFSDRYAGNGDIYRRDVLRKAFKKNEEELRSSRNYSVQTVSHKKWRCHVGSSCGRRRIGAVREGKCCRTENYLQPRAEEEK